MTLQYSTVIDADDERHADDYGMFSTEGEIAVTILVNRLCHQIETEEIADRESACLRISEAIVDIHARHPEVLDTVVMDEIGWRLDESFNVRGWPEWNRYRDFLSTLLRNH